MTADQIKQLEDRLWTAADQLRANSKLTATEYSFPVLGLIFLRHAFNRFVVAKEEIEAKLPVHPQRGRRTITKEDFTSAKALYLPEKSRWDYLSALPESTDIGQELDEAMREIEKQHENLTNVLPKNYTLFEKELLFQLVRTFNDEALNGVTGDVFGRIYEYFLNEFAKKGAQEGGEFFTPPSLVNAIVNVIEPDHGTVFDPACGSAGMFVQTAHFIEEEGFDAAQKVNFYGQEKTSTNIKLAKMNMAVHGMDAKLVEGNTFYEDHHALVGKCDFVMANPPFNVDGVDKDKDGVKNDTRLPFGLPKNDNANYLWIQYFYSYLNDKGRAGFVMASSASDAGHSEKLIRQQLVETGAVDVMVTIGPKFFYTRSLPCTLWFLDKAKAKDETCANQTLMLDLREVYRKVSSNLHDFTPEHLRNIHAIVGLYRGNTGYFKKTIEHYAAQEANYLAQLIEAIQGMSAMKAPYPGYMFKYADIEKLKIADIKKLKRELTDHFKHVKDSTKEVMADDTIKLEREFIKTLREYLQTLDEATKAAQELAELATYFHKEYTWMTSRFPDGTYTDVAGLCKVVSRGDIAANDYSLTAGRYVGVAPQHDEDFDYEERMKEIKLELASLNEEATELAEKIQLDLEELGI